MPENNPIPPYIREMGGVFKFGKGVMGKSTIALVTLLVVGGVAMCRLPPAGVIIVFLILVAITIAWFCKIEKFAVQHPDLAVLDGAEWRRWKVFEASAKNPGEAIDTQAELGNPLPPPEKRKELEGPDQ